MKFGERMEKIFKEGIETSKEMLEKAKEKTKEAGEKGALKFKIKKLERQAERDFAKLGTKVYEILVEKGQNTVSKGTSEIKELIQEIDKLEKEIDKNEEAIKKL
jgi:hypothetical protein